MAGKKQEVDELLDHNYDGIQEYNNPAPGWLMYTLYGSMVFAVLYVVFYGFNFGPSIQSAYLQESRSLELQWAAYYAEHPIVPPTTDELKAATKDTKLVDSGKAQFATSCSPCHGASAQGLIGPNLTDSYWLHGGQMTQVYTTIVQGVPGKGMPPWGRALAPDKIKGIVAYLRTVQGSNPANAKAPQGDLVQAEGL